jgi:hypothetical protein
VGAKEFRQGFRLIYRHTLADIQPIFSDFREQRGAFVGVLSVDFKPRFQWSWRRLLNCNNCSAQIS